MVRTRQKAKEERLSQVESSNQDVRTRLVNPTTNSHTTTTTTGTTKERTHKSRSSIKCLIIISSSILLPAIIIGAFMYNVDHIQRLEPIKYADVLVDEPAHKWIYSDEFFSRESLDVFRKLVSSDPTAATFTTTNDPGGVESAGEAVPVGHVDCRHPFMTLNLNRTMCHFSNRLDVGMHFVKTGGFNGHIEYFERMVARIIPFRKRLFTPQENGDVQTSSRGDESSEPRLLDVLKSIPEFSRESFVNDVKTVCEDSAVFADSRGLGTIVTEMFQLDMVVMLPGQELPIHLNTPYFWGADRFAFPQWLLVVMKNSKLFDHLFIPQVQGFLPFALDDADESSDGIKSIDRRQGGFVEINGQGGDFYFYPYKPKSVKDKTEENFEHVREYVILKSIENSAIILDGAQVMHGVDRYKPNNLPPLFGNVNHHYTLKLDPKSPPTSSQWLLYDFENNLLRRYAKHEPKFVLVWNMHCFRSESERVRFHSAADSARRQLTLEHVMDVFKRDLRARDRLPSEKIDPLELWTIVLKEYLRYPTNQHQQNSTLFGLNYCLLPNLAPNWLNERFLQPFLANRC